MTHAEGVSVRFLISLLFHRSGICSLLRFHFGKCRFNVQNFLYYITFENLQ